MGISQEMPGDSGKVYLRKKITLIRAIALTVGTIIGSGIFISPKGVLKNSGNVGLSLVIWVACGLLSMCGEYWALKCNLIPKDNFRFGWPLAGYIYATSSHSWRLWMVRCTRVLGSVHMVHLQQCGVTWAENAAEAGLFMLRPVVLHM